MSLNLDEYTTAKEKLFDSLAVIDSYVDGLHKPQVITSNTWTEVQNVPGVWIKPIVLHQPAHFALALVHGFKGANDAHHRVTDNVELHCIMGRLHVNGLEFKAGDRVNIPANVEHSFQYMEDSYLTAKFTPVNPEKPTHFSKHGCDIPLDDDKTTN